MKDLVAALGQISGLARLYLFGETAGSVNNGMIDSGPLAQNGAYKAFINSPFGANAQQPSHLLDQHRKKYSYCFTAGHASHGGTSSYNQYALDTQAADNPNNASYSMVFAGMKIHDMSVARGWHHATGAATSGQGMGVAVDTDGTLMVMPGTADAWVRSSPGALVRFLPQLLVVSYDNSTGHVSAYAGDWTGRWSTVINAAAAHPVTAYPAGDTVYLGAPYNDPTVTNYADGFLDAFALHIGHAITASEAARLFDQCGYLSGNTYPKTLSHRNSVINQVKTPGMTLDADSTAAANEYYTTQIKSPPAGAGGGGWNTDQNAIAIYHVTKAYRDSLPTVGMLVGYSQYTTYAPGWMLSEDCPLPHGGLPSAGFLPSGLASDGSWSSTLRADWQTNTGSAAPVSVWDVTPSSGGDHTVGIMCDETDEYWEAYQIHNTNPPVAGSAQSTVGNPVWSAQYGQKQSQFSLQWGGGRDNTIGCRATGIPVILGTPTIADQQAALAKGTPLKYATTGNCLNAKSGTQKWPALRNDGTLSTSHVVQGQVYRFKQDAATTARIAAMASPIGRVWATAMQTYGHIPNDKTLYAMLMQGQSPEEYKILSMATNGGTPVEPYYQVGNGPGAPYSSASAIPTIQQGISFTGTIMQDAPWDAMEVLDSNHLNPMWAGQAIQSAPAVTAKQQGSYLTKLVWGDNPLVDHWNVYTKSAGVYTLVASTEWPEYTHWSAGGTLTYAVTAVNGAGESTNSADTVPVALNPRRQRRFAL